MWICCSSDSPCQLNDVRKVFGLQWNCSVYIVWISLGRRRGLPSGLGLWPWQHLQPPKTTLEDYDNLTRGTLYSWKSKQGGRPWCFLRRKRKSESGRKEELYILFLSCSKSFDLWVHLPSPILSLLIAYFLQFLQWLRYLIASSVA